MYTPFRSPGMLFSGALLLVGAVFLAGCQTLREVAQLREVDFELGGVTSATLAGIDLSEVRSYRDLSPRAALQLGAALREGQIPFSFVLNVLAENPDANQYAARLIELDWTFFLEGRETVSGTLEREILLPPGEVTTIPVGIELDLVEFFGDNVQDLVELALSVSGQGGAPKELALRAVPTISTPVGPIRYPRPITIVAREVGGAAVTR